MHLDFSRVLKEMFVDSFQVSKLDMRNLTFLSDMSVKTECIFHQYSNYFSFWNCSFSAYTWSSTEEFP